jgi:hypothetical protein
MPREFGELPNAWCFGKNMKFKNLLTVLASIVLGSCASTPAMADLLTNGGFETGDFTGWTQDGNIGSTFASQGLYDSYLPYSGTYFAALGPIGSDGTLSQSVATTPGQLYTLTFYLASNGITPNDFTATFNNQVVFTGTNLDATSASSPYTYVQETFTTLATSTSTPLVFAFRNDPSYLALDDVSVVKTPSSAPEPASLALFAAGLATALAGRFLRSR